MGMGIGINTANPDAGDVKGCQVPIACGVWFTSTGRAIPKMIKWLDSEGSEHILQHIHIQSEEHKFYCGIPAIEYVCDAVIGTRRQDFRLLFYVEEQQWKLLWKNTKENR